MSLGRLLKDIAPVLIGATFGPGIGTALAGTGASPLVSRAITGALTSKIMGGKNKDALRNAFITGLTGAAFDSFGGGREQRGRSQLQGVDGQHTRSAPNE